MKKKICSKCKEEKDVCEFYVDKTKTDGYYNCCKECKKTYLNERKDKQKEYLKSWRLNNPNYSKEYRQNNPTYTKKYYQNNRDTLLSRVKKHYLLNKEKNLEKYRKLSKKYYENNKEQRLEYRKKYSENNRDKRNEYIKNKKLSNPIFHLSHTIRNRLRNFLRTKNLDKNNKTFEIIGCSPIFLKEHLQKQFTENMSWDNYGTNGWHIDHIIPLSSANTEEDLYKLCHYTNLQPLWAKDNLQKSNKICK
jgi:hypothetical protein